MAYAMNWWIEISTHSLTRRLTCVSTSEGFFQKVISTHSLTRRLTKSRYITGKRSSYFNSQPHKEADGKELEENCGMIFQLTASQGG